MKRWRLRKALVFLLVCTVPAYILAHDKLSVFWRFTIPVGIAIISYVFGRYDLRHDFEPDDPARKELENDIRDEDKSP
jgi:hypothetical protein